MAVVKIQQHCQILAGSVDANGMNNTFLFIILIEFNCLLGLFPSSI